MNDLPNAHGASLDAPERRLRVLLVDDRRENLVALESLLKNEPIEVLTALSGEEALERLLDGSEVALAILDVQMPSMSGYELAELMRGTEKTKHIPIIFLTANHRDEASTFRGYESGAVDYLFKPIEATVFLSKVRIFMELADQRRELEERMKDLRAARDAAQAANRAKSTFLANMSHEIRTPLGAILGFAELALLVPRSVQDLRANLEAIRRNGQQLLGILNDVLDFSKIEAGMLQVEEVDIELRSFLSELKNNFAGLAHEKGLSFEFHLDENTVPERISSDPVRLRQVLQNLLSNALKFTREGFIRVNVRKASSELLEIEVSDSGIGIEGEHTTQLFKPFVQADSSTTRRFGGTGLGLAISRRIAEALGGKLVLKSSEVGRGSCFALTIRFREASKAAASFQAPRNLLPQQLRERLKDRKIMIVEDSADNREIVSRFLSSEGAQLRTATNGYEALNLVSQENFDAIVMDIQMPEMDGYAATEALRAKHFRGPIVALTAHSSKEERDRCFKVGCDAHLVKPTEREHLVDTLYSLLRADRSKGLRLMKGSL
jgi:signal transduction histidine kinase